MVCCVPAIPLCLSRAFWGLDPTYFQGPQGGIKADWALRVRGWGTISFPYARLTSRNRRTRRRSRDVRHRHRSRTPGGGQTFTNPAQHRPALRWLMEGLQEAEALTPHKWGRYPRPWLAEVTQTQTTSRGDFIFLPVVRTVKKEPLQDTGEHASDRRTSGPRSTKRVPCAAGFTYVHKNKKETKQTLTCSDLRTDPHSVWLSPSHKKTGGSL